MSSLYGVNSDSSSSFISDYFATKNTYSGTNTSLSISDYSMIQSGSYKKLLTKYYAENETTKGTASANQDTTKELLLVKDGAALAKEKGTSLTNTEVASTSRSQLLKSVQGFVKEYNALVEDVGDLESVPILQNGVWMTNQAKANKNVLAKAGITIGSDNTLSLDETVFNKAEVSSLQSVLSGKSSAVGQLTSRISQIQTLAGNQAMANTKGSSYTSSGSYQGISTSKLYNGLF